MSERRLSKLQKWILENCFKVTVLLDKTDLKELHKVGHALKCKDCSKTRECVRINHNNATLCGKDGFHCPYFEFYKEDILLSFFLLTPNNDITHFNRVQHFYDSPDYTKAHVTVHRSIKSLAEKGYIYPMKVFREDSLQIHLTDEGIKKAAELLKIDDYELPDKS